jgi:hypothetical protein
MLLIIGFSLVIIFGYLLSILFVERMCLFERMGLSFLLGFGVFTLFMFCYSTFGVKITLQSTLLALTFCILIAILIAKALKRKILADFNLSRPLKAIFNLSHLETILALLIGSLGFGSLLLTTYFPVYIWDALALYDFRGKIIAQVGYYTQIANNYFWFGGYPLFTSLSHTLIYIFGGSNPQFLYTFMYISFILIFYSALHEFVSRKITLIMSLILAATPVIFDHSTFAYTNLPYAIFLALGSIYLFVWFFKKKPVGYIILSAVLTGLSTWDRSAEPFWAINIIILGALLIFRFKKYLLPAIIYIISFLPIREPWNLINYYFLTDSTAAKPPLVLAEGGSYVTTLLSTRLEPDRIKEIGIFIYQNVIISWFPLFFLFLFCVLINFRGILRKTSTSFLVVISLYFILLLYATYMYSFGIAYWNTIPDSARRMAMFFMPLMIFYIGLSFGDLSPGKKK